MKREEYLEMRNAIADKAVNVIVAEILGAIARKSQQITINQLDNKTLGIDIRSDIPTLIFDRVKASLLEHGWRVVASHYDSNCDLPRHWSLLWNYQVAKTSNFVGQYTNKITKS